MHATLSFMFKWSRIAPVAMIAFMVSGGRSDPPRIAEAPPYDPPPFTTPPPEMKDESGQSYQYGSHPDYVKGMQMMEAQQQ